MKTIKPYRRRRSKNDKNDEVNTAYATCSGILRSSQYAIGAPPHYNYVFDAENASRTASRAASDSEAKLELWREPS